MTRKFSADSHGKTLAPASLTRRRRVPKSSRCAPQRPRARIPPKSVSSARSLVDSINYRHTLKLEGIVLQHRHASIPKSIARLVEKMSQLRSSPEPSIQDILDDVELEALEGGYEGTPESIVQQYFQQKIFPLRDVDGPLDLSVQLPILGHAVPQTSIQGSANKSVKDISEKRKISGPVPDLLYGYKFRSFTMPQKNYLEDFGYELQATTYQLYCPFFIVEFKGEGGVARVATNQCLGGAACCVNITERLNRKLEACSSTRPGVQTVDGAVFSVAMDGNMARLFVSWRREDQMGYCTARVRDFAVQEPSEYLKFRAHVLNIIDWGRNERLQQVCAALDFLVEESHRTTPAAFETGNPLFVPDGPKRSAAKDTTSGGDMHRRMSARLGAKVVGNSGVC